MYQLTPRLTIPINAVRALLTPRRLTAGTLALVSLLSAQAPVSAQAIGSSGERCFVVADNNPPGGGSGGVADDDTLIQINFGTGTATAIDGGIIAREGGGTNIRNIEAMTSRSNSNELIAANGSEFGRIDPETAVFTPLIGSLGPFNDFDAIVIDRNSTNQTRLLAVSKDTDNVGNPNPALNNILVTGTISLNATGQAEGITPTTQVALSNFPAGTDGIDGIALIGNTLYGIANRGGVPNSAQILVTIDQASGIITPVAPFTLGVSVGGLPAGTAINDVEDLDLSLFGNLFGSTGSNNNVALRNRGYTFDPATGVAINSLAIGALSGRQDFEASACITDATATGQLLIVKRITAVTRGGVRTEFDTFTDQAGETDDNTMLAATGNAFPLGIPAASPELNTGDQVEYTVYIYNPTSQIFNNAVICDAIEPPSILQSSSVELAAPTVLTSPLAFTPQPNTVPRPPASPAPATGECAPLLGTATVFPPNTPNPLGPSGGLDVGAGGGIVTTPFSLNPNQITALRFQITVGQP
ncbi:MAG: hypothetical protein HC800_03185 [Phormidesmis sp. RL_2_1]|nr:hypothetical protein [Phormidesmis sp. RL_2_1]